MQLTKKQEEGLKIAIARYKNKESYTCIAGYAGTGKTTLIRFIIDALEIPQDKVAYIAYTGKASLVMRNNGCPTSVTAHKFLYKANKTTNKNSKFLYTFQAKEKLDKDYQLIVVDEVSMIPKRMWEQLLSHKIHAIAMGDPFQLSALGENTDILNHPHIFLDEIMRQTEDNEIIRLSMNIRNKNNLKLGKFNNTHLMLEKDLHAGMFTWADQILCGKNETRKNINETCRKIKFNNPNLNEDPLINDKIICVKNDWDRFSLSGEVLMNGTIGIIKDIKLEQSKMYRKYMDYNCWITLDSDDDLFIECYSDYKYLTTDEPTINRENMRKFPKGFTMDLFEYGYAITCWKAQGSEYNKVLFLAERVGTMDREMYARYLYTGVTRARDKLVLVLPGK